ncbi:hypothetical protein B0H16DRAFT_1585197 [Mycena metata]|uniref:Uncharacterized protein n=1 Tax=Mycena metata TaxID=1033252 RepID=A0AAD7HXK9_9AGAR|nr:hypothetical protein B0H16DRAFT_1585197 [Mycena metata]
MTPTVTVYFYPLASPRIPKGFKDGPFHPDERLPEGPLQKYDIVCSAAVAELWSTFSSIIPILLEPVPTPVDPSTREAYSTMLWLDHTDRRTIIAYKERVVDELVKCYKALGLPWGIRTNPTDICFKTLKMEFPSVDDAWIELKITGFMFSAANGYIYAFQRYEQEVAEACSTWTSLWATKDHLSRQFQESFGGAGESSLGNNFPIAGDSGFGSSSTPRQDSVPRDDSDHSSPAASDNAPPIPEPIRRRRIQP